MARSTRKADWQGMNWIRQDKRLAIYLRDGMACVWCGATVEKGARLSLDHVIPHVNGGSNHESNLVTSCCTCNSSRGDRTVEEFAAAVAAYVNHGVTATEIMLRISVLVIRPLAPYRAEAKEIKARRVVTA
jgi:hypothetical protein